MVTDAYGTPMYDIPPGAHIDARGRVVDAYNRDLGAKEDFSIDWARAGSAAESGPLTPEDRQRIAKANAETLGVQAGVGALAQLAQVGLSAIPTETDTRNAAKLEELRGREQRGELGLSANERQAAEAQALNPARALATEGRQRSADRLAAMGGTSLAAQSAVEAAANQASQEAAVRGGEAVMRANIEAEQRNRRELEQRTQYEANKQAQTIDRISQTLGDLATMGGKIAAAQVQSRAFTDDELRKLSTATDANNQPLYPEYAGMEPKDIRAKMSAQQSVERDFRKFKRDEEATKRRLEAMRKRSDDARKGGLFTGPKDEVDARGPSSEWLDYDPFSAAGAPYGGQ